MPYLDNKIEKHKNTCSNPVGKRLYIRDYDDNGRQRFTSWGLTCTTCGVVIKQEFEHKLTNKVKEYLNISEKLGQDKEDALKHYQKYKVIDKLQRLHRKRQGNRPITPKENGIRIRIKNLANTVYWSHKDEIVWDNELVQEFLNLEPRPTYIDLKHVMDLLPDKRKLSRLGWSPNPEKPGYLKYDGKDHSKERLRIIQDCALKQQETMRHIIKQRLEGEKQQ